MVKDNSQVLKIDPNKVIRLCNEWKYVEYKIKRS